MRWARKTHLDSGCDDDEVLLYLTAVLKLDNAIRTIEVDGELPQCDTGRLPREMLILNQPPKFLVQIDSMVHLEGSAVVLLDIREFS